MNKKITINCVFCEVAASSLMPNYGKIFKNRDYFVMLSAHPQTQGHLLVIPQEHVTNLSGLSQKLMANLLGQAVKYGEMIKNRLNAGAYTIKINNGVHRLENSDVRHVNHIHIHVIPRYSSNDKINTPPKKASDKILMGTMRLLMLDKSVALKRSLKL